MISTYESEFYLGRKASPPLNLAYLARIIQSQGHDYDVIDSMASTDESTLGQLKTAGYSIEEVVKRIPHYTDVIGITAMFTSEWIVVRELSKLIRHKFPSTIIIIGGEHATCDAHNIITYEPTIDICFRGEAELSLEQFIKNYQNKNFSNVNGITFRDINGCTISTPVSERIKNLDELLPLWDKIPVNFYLKHRLSYSQAGKISMPILATRGCPYVCTFCTNEMMWGNTYTKRSPESIVEEMKQHHLAYGVHHFDFIDLAMAINRSWLKELCLLIQREIPNISWEMTVGTRSEILDLEILTLLQKSGNAVVCYAPETGSKSMAKKIKKRINFDKLYRSVKTAIELDLDVKANLILNFPNETFRETFATIFMALRLGFMGVKGVSMFSFTPFPGTLLGRASFPEKCESYEQYNRIILNETGIGGAKVVNFFKILSHPKEQLYALLTNGSMVLSYALCLLRRPKYLKSLFINTLNGTPVAPVEVAIFSLLRKHVPGFISRGRPNS